LAIFANDNLIAHNESVKEATMRVMTYLNFNGNCEEAFHFYSDHLGGQTGAIFRYGGSPMEHLVPADWSEKVMHGSITVGGQELMGADVVPDQYQEPKGFSVSLQTSSIEEAEHIYRELAKGGRLLMPLEETFWAARFGMVVDRFGVPWMINCGESGQSTEAVG
jgi:PhnB protein